jgi:lipoprotein signal peptidase
MMHSLYKILLKLCQILAWLLAFFTIPIMGALWVVCTLSIAITLQMLLVLHPALGRKVDRMFEHHFIDRLFSSK